MFQPASARQMLTEARALTAALDPAAGHPGLPTFQSAVVVVDTLATTTGILAQHVQRLGAYIEAEAAAGRLQALDEFPDTNVVRSASNAYTATNAAVRALEDATRALTRLHDATSGLRTAPPRAAAPATVAFLRPKGTGEESG